MKPYITQPNGSSCCGAYSIAYYLWETGRSKCINDRSFVDSIYEKIEFGANDFGFYEKLSSPMKMCDELNDTWKAPACLCVSPASPFNKIQNLNGILAKDDDVLENLKHGKDKYAIIICNLISRPNVLHYILTKFKDESFELLDSWDVLENNPDNVGWEKVSINSPGTFTLENGVSYGYLGAGILIE